MNLSFEISDSMSDILLQPTLQFILIGELPPMVSPSLNVIMLMSLVFHTDIKSFADLKQMNPQDLLVSSLCVDIGFLFFIDVFQFYPNRIQ